MIVMSMETMLIAIKSPSSTYSITLGVGSNEIPSKESVTLYYLDDKTYLIAVFLAFDFIAR